MATVVFWQRTLVKLRVRSVLSIAGSDSGGGAGIQADVRTITAHGLHPLTSITALTAQNTRGVTAVHACPAIVLRAQIDSAFADFDVAAVKIGMLANAEVIRCVADALRAHPTAPIVLDPVMVATSGAALLDPASVACLVDLLFPIAALVTPNIPEAIFLGAANVSSSTALPHAAAAIRKLGARAVLLKGGHLDGQQVVDWLDDGTQTCSFVHPRLALEGHGTGCTLSSAIACGLALGKPLKQACADATDYVHGALQHAYRPGQTALAVLGHNWQSLHD